jgi:hypothetical protein
MRTLRTGLVGLVALSAACGVSQSPSASPVPKPGTAAAESSETEPRTLVHVDNQNFNDMNIYLVNQGARMRLGTASGLSRTMLVLPATALVRGWHITLQADPIGGAPVIRTPSLQVAPGQSVYWTIGMNPASSYASVS